MKELIDKMVEIDGTRDAVALKLGYSTNYLYKLYAGTRKPTDPVLNNIKAKYPKLSNLVTAIHLDRIN